ncbi:MAG: hypothetical protein DI548_02895 [Flavobacterium johnsoniae]|nr:MAG: hypothetical protein DI548_02895 [Flavobacterium johnsoniae]
MFRNFIFNIALRLSSYSYGLIFGFNTFIALVLQSILTVVVVENIGFGLSIKPQVSAPIRINISL